MQNEIEITSFINNFSFLINLNSLCVLVILNTELRNPLYEVYFTISIIIKCLCNKIIISHNITFCTRGFFCFSINDMNSSTLKLSKSSFCNLKSFYAGFYFLCLNAKSKPCGKSLALLQHQMLPPVLKEREPLFPILS